MLATSGVDNRISGGSKTFDGVTGSKVLFVDTESGRRVDWFDS